MPAPPSSPTPTAAAPPDPPLVGTDTLGRPFTNAERLAFDRLLRRHAFHSCHRAAIAFAHKLSHNAADAEDLAARALLRLARQGWDPAEVPLRKRLCRLVYSEWTHWLEEKKTRREAERTYTELMRLYVPLHSLPTDDQYALAAAEAEREARAEARMARMRAMFTEADDQVNLAWLDLTAEGLDTPEQMVARTRFTPRDFYLAAERRKAVTKRLIAEARGATLKEDEP
jgi:DNA-directed RNA polymerase specialized sigma24 family protein